LRNVYGIRRFRKKYMGLIRRGNGGQDIFFSPSDRYCLYLLLQEGIEKYGQKPPLTRLAFYFL